MKPLNQIKKGDKVIIRGEVRIAVSDIQERPPNFILSLINKSGFIDEFIYDNDMVQLPTPEDDSGEYITTDLGAPHIMAYVFLEFINSESKKFYEMKIELDRNTVGSGITRYTLIKRYGRIGTKGQTLEETRLDRDSVKSIFEKLRKSKIRKGYVQKERKVHKDFEAQQDSQTKPEDLPF